MLILTIRTDKPEAEIGLYEGSTQLAYEIWVAHRQLAETIHIKIQKLLASQQKNLNDIQGIVCFQGPGSFTGLRIGLSVANALANSLPAVIVGQSGDETNSWLEKGLARLMDQKNDHLVMPEYGAEVHITLPKH